LYITGQYQQAVALLQTVIAASPTDLQSTMMLAGAYEYLHETTLSITELQSVASSSPQNATAIMKYIGQIKQGINPFIPTPTSAQSAASASVSAGQ
jgi:cytochrome c-type biogenesis protein CcmH/NrfG